MKFERRGSRREVYESDVAEQHRQFLDKSLDEILIDAQHKQSHRSLELLEWLAKARDQTNLRAFRVLTPLCPNYQQLVSQVGVPSLFVIGGDSGVVSSLVAEELKRLKSEIAH